LVCYVVALAFGLVLAQSAEAETYTIFGSNSKQMSGPVQLGYVPGNGTATGPASQLGSVMIPGGAFHVVGTTFNFFPSFPGFAQLVSSHTSSQTATQTLAVNGGPGNFEFCPPIGNPLNPACNQAAGLAGYLGFQGFVDYDQGVNQFGGTFRIARKQMAVVSARIATNPSQFAHQKGVRGAPPAIAGGPTTFRSPYFVPTPSAPPSTPIRADWAPGLPTLSQYFRATPGEVTVSPVLDPTGGFILTPGPVGTAAPITPNPSTSTGFPFTTGMIRQVGINSLGGVTAFTVTGGNFRGPTGQGNLVLVAGGINQSRAGNSVPTYAIMKINLPEPGMGIGLAAGFGLLMALVRRRRES
jgi:hypothetical protein